MSKNFDRVEVRWQRRVAWHLKKREEGGVHEQEDAGSDHRGRSGAPGAGSGLHHQRVGDDRPHHRDRGHPLLRHPVLVEAALPQGPGFGVEAAVLVQGVQFKCLV